MKCRLSSAAVSVLAGFWLQERVQHEDIQFGLSPLFTISLVLKRDSVAAVGSDPVTCQQRGKRVQTSGSCCEDPQVSRFENVTTLLV